MKLLSIKTNEDIYLEFLNNWLTFHAMAEYYGVSRHYLKQKINKGRKDHYKKFEL